MVVVPPVDELDLVAPLQVFNSVNRLAGRTIYSLEVVTNSPRMAFEGEGGVLTFVARDHFAKVNGPCDSVLLVCGLTTRSVRDPALSAWLNTQAGAVRRLGAVCVGAFLLAEAGLLNGRRATAHWRFGRELAARYPRVCVEHEPLWVKDGNIYTSAGISASIDLALAWVEEDCGAGGRRHRVRRRRRDATGVRAAARHYTAPLPRAGDIALGSPRSGAAAGPFAGRSIRVMLKL